MRSNQNNLARSFRMFGDWKSQSAQLKEQFSMLTDADLDFNTDIYEENSTKQLLRRIESKLNIKRHEAIEIIKSVQPRV